MITFRRKKLSDTVVILWQIINRRLFFINLQHAVKIASGLYTLFCGRDIVSQTAHVTALVKSKSYMHNRYTILHKNMYIRYPRAKVYKTHFLNIPVFPPKKSRLSRHWFYAQFNLVANFERVSLIREVLMCYKCSWGLKPTNV